MIKRKLAMFLALLICGGTLTACGKQEEESIEIVDNPDVSATIAIEPDTESETFNEFNETDAPAADIPDKTEETSSEKKELKGNLTDEEKTYIQDSLNHMMMSDALADNDFNILYLILTGEYKTDSELEQIIAGYELDEETFSLDKWYNLLKEEDSPEIKEERRQALLEKKMYSYHSYTAAESLDTAEETTGTAYEILSGTHLDVNSEEGKQYLQELYQQFDEIADCHGTEHMDYSNILNIEDLYVVSYVKIDKEVGNTSTMIYDNVPLVFYDGHLRYGSTISVYDNIVHSKDEELPLTDEDKKKLKICNRGFDGNWKDTEEVIYYSDFGLIYLICTGEYKTDAELVEIVRNFDIDSLETTPITSKEYEQWDNPEMQKKIKDLLLAAYIVKARMYDEKPETAAETESKIEIESGIHYYPNKGLWGYYSTGMRETDYNLAVKLNTPLDEFPLYEIEDIYSVDYANGSNSPVTYLYYQHEGRPRVQLFGRDFMFSVAEIEVCIAYPEMADEEVWFPG